MDYFKDYDFSFLTDAKKAKDYDGFISPNGEFYPVSIKNKHNPTHQEWAYEYVTKKTNFIKLLAKPNGSLLYILARLQDKQDVLIHYYGFVYYGHDNFSRRPLLIFPDTEINGKKITKEQKRILFDIMYLSNEESYYPDDIKSFMDEEKHINYVDDFISRRLEEENYGESKRKI